MKKYLVFAVAFALLVASAAQATEGRTSKSGTVPSRSQDEETVSGSDQIRSNPVTVKFTTNITTDGTSIYAVNTFDQTIQKIVIATGDVSTFAGFAGVTGASDGFGSGALLNYPQGIATDGTNLYVADTGNCTIRKIVIATGGVSTLAGTAGKCGSADGTGAAAQFVTPYGVAVVGSSLYVVETKSGLIRKIDIPSGTVTTLIVSAKADVATGEQKNAFMHPTAITSDETHLYVIDNDGKIIRKVVIPTGEVTTLAGTPGALGYADGNGAAALFGVSYGIATDGVNLYVADTYNSSIRKIVISTGKVSTLAGRAGTPGVDDGTAAAAHFNMVAGMAINGNDLYVVNNGNNAIRKIAVATGKVATLVR